MSDLLLSTLAVALVTALGMAALAALTLLPFVLTLRLAERRGFAAARWGAVSLAASVLGLGLVAVVLRSDRSAAAVLVGVVVAFTGPLAVSVLERGSSVGGRPGRHA